MIPSSLIARSERVRRFARRGSAGLTLIEVIVVLAIVALVATVAIAGSNQLPSTKLRRSAMAITSQIKRAYVQATSTSRDLRLVMDIDQKRMWLEESLAPMLVRAKDPSAAGGAEAVTEAERQAAMAHSTTGRPPSSANCLRWPNRWPDPPATTTVSPTM